MYIRIYRINIYLVYIIIIVIKFISVYARARDIAYEGEMLHCEEFCSCLLRQCRC